MYMRLAVQILSACLQAQNCLAAMAGVAEVRQQSWAFPYVCMNKISLLKWSIVVAVLPFG
jgi:hypothetical protein